MFNNVDIQERISNIMLIFSGKLKYVIGGIIIFIILLFVIFQPRDKTINFTSLEEKIVTASKEYYNSNVYQQEKFISLHMLSDQSFLDLKPYSDINCNASSGVLIENNEFKAYLVCTGYKSPAITEKIGLNDNIKLKGQNPLILGIGTPYEELGYESSEKVTVTGSVKEQLGLQVINYQLEDGSSINRLIIVTDSEEDENVHFQDYNGLELSLKGEKSLIITTDMNYEDLGAFAYDSIDGNITSKIEKQGVVDTNKIGTYTLTYAIQNSRGYRISTTREVIVEAPYISPPIIITNTIPSTPTNTNVKITASIKDVNYKYTILPNNTKTYSKNIEYEVSNNGNYKFIIYNINNEAYTENVVVNNIDRSVPNGSCYAKASLVDTVINVISNNNNYTYSYSIGKSSTAYLSSKTYTFNEKAEMAIVKMKDALGNIKTITCNMDKETTDLNQPLVYIYNSHQNESYVGVPSGQKTGVLQIALQMRDLLVKEGIPTLVEEGDIYAEIKKTAAARKARGASRYEVSEKFIKAAREKHPSLVFFLDIHRNSSSPMTVINGKEYAVFFFLIGASHNNYKKNLAVATAIDTPIRAAYPTLARKIYVRGEHNEGIFWYNQFLGEYFQLIEVGGVQNTLQQAKNTIDLITPFFADYIKKTFMQKG